MHGRVLAPVTVGMRLTGFKKEAKSVSILTNLIQFYQGGISVLCNVFYAPAIIDALGLKVNEL